MGAAILAHRTGLNAFSRNLNGPTTAAGSLAIAGSNSASTVTATPPATPAYRYRTADMTSQSNGSTVASISFQTGTLSLSSGGGTTSPTYLASGQNTRPALRFDGTDDYLNSSTAPNALAQPMSIVVVLDVKTVSGRREFVAKSGGGFDMEINDDVANSYELYAGQVLTGGTPSTGLHVLSWVFNTTASLAQVDGTQIFSGNGGNTALTGLQLGQSGGNSAYAQMDLYEVLIYSRALSSSELTQVRQYVSSYYGF